MVCMQCYSFEFIVVCIGKYGDVPKVPEFPQNKGPEIFEGKVMHTLDYCKLEEDSASALLKDKKVAVIGYKKSAIDLALECAHTNQGIEVIFIVLFHSFSLENKKKKENIYLILL